MYGVLAGKIDEFFFGKRVEDICRKKKIPFINLLDTKRDYNDGIDFIIGEQKVDFTTYPFDSPRKDVIMVIRDEDAIDVHHTEGVINAILGLTKPGVIELPGYKIEKK